MSFVRGACLALGVALAATGIHDDNTWLLAVGAMLIGLFTGLDKRKAL